VSTGHGMAEEKKQSGHVATHIGGVTVLAGDLVAGTSNIDVSHCNHFRLLEEVLQTS